MTNPDPDDRDPALEAATTLARWMDGRFLDPALGFLLPGVGDVLSSALGIYPIFLAWRRQAGKALVARMLLNLAVDALGGSVPILGDIWDFFFKAHTRNLALLRARTVQGTPASRPADTLVVVAAGFALLAALAAPVVLLVVVAKWLARG